MNALVVDLFGEPIPVASLVELAAQLCSVNQNAADVAARVQAALNAAAGRQKGQP